MQCRCCRMHVVNPSVVPWFLFGFLFTSPSPETEKGLSILMNKVSLRDDDPEGDEEGLMLLNNNNEDCACCLSLSLDDMNMTIEGLRVHLYSCFT